MMIGPALRRFLLRRFAAVYRADHRFRHRVTATGQMAMAALGGALIFGINTRVSMAAQIFAFLAAMFGLAGLACLRFRPQVRVERHLPEQLSVAAQGQYTLTICNTGKRWQKGLCLQDELQQDWPSYEEFIRYRDPDDRLRNSFDRLVGYPRWAALVQLQRGADLPVVPLPPLAPGASAEIIVRFMPLRRGVLHFAACRVIRSDPFGLLNTWLSHELPASLLVVPKRYPLTRRKLQGGRIYQPGGVTLANTAGDSQEFVSLREYRPGDSLRAIHWRSLAKVGKPIVKEYRPEYFSRFALVLDTFADTLGDQLFEDAVSVAASLAAAVDMREHLLDTIFVGDKAYCFTTGCGLGEYREVLRILACVAPALHASFSQLEQMVLQHAARFSGCILVLQGWDEPRRRMAKRLRARGIALQVLLVVEATMAAEQARQQADGDEFVCLTSGRIGEGLARL